MLKSYTFWLKTASVILILTACIHSLSLFNDPVPANDTEKQLIDLMGNYKMDLGAGFQPTMSDLFTSMSVCFSMLYLFGGLLNLYLLRKKAGADLLSGVIRIETLIYGVTFVVFLCFTFLPPIVLAGLVVACLAMAWWRV
ncbi:MAG TPA: hypothetical protein PKL15_00445 [Saprospiraceae bacterium]|nr:hypothetical protein [Saprospiraceae bacterium]HNM23855.1 hypothetical protein [Saprospiraceae bacterium]